MPIRYSRVGSVAVGRCVGSLRADDIISSARAASGGGELDPYGDRIIVLDPDLSLADMDNASLSAVREAFLEGVKKSGKQPRFRAVYVVGTPRQKSHVALYKARWDELGLPGVEMYAADNEEEAWKILGLEPPATD